MASFTQSQSPSTNLESPALTQDTQIEDTCDSPVISEEMNMLYLQVDKSRTSLDILGLSRTTAYTRQDFKVTYRSLALQLHPDKCRPSQIELHTRLFAKVQNAYEDVCEKAGGEGVQDDDLTHQNSGSYTSSSEPYYYPESNLRTQPKPQRNEVVLEDFEPAPVHASTDKQHHKTRKDNRHAAKDVKAERRYQEAWNEQRKRR